MRAYLPHGYLKAEEGGAALPKKKQRAAKEKKSYVAAYS